MNFSDVLKECVLVLDGGMGTMVQRLGLTDADYGGPAYKMLADIIALSRPHELQGIHLAYLTAGANIIETNTFGASELRLQEYDLTGLNTSCFEGIENGLEVTRLSPREFAYHLNVASARVAKRAQEQYQKTALYDGRPLYVFGCVGPSNYVLSPTLAELKKGSYDQVVENFYHQVLGLIDGGAEGLCYDTAQDQLELKAAIHGGQKAMRERGVSLPIIAHVTVDQFSRMALFHTDILASYATVCDLGIDAFGINCSLGPDLMEPTIKKLADVSHLPISVMPNAGLPVSENGKTVFKLRPQELAEHALSFVEQYGVRLVGGCCGTTPEHIRAVADAVRTKKPVIKKTAVKVWVSGPQNAVCLDRGDSLIRIGERLNVRGSKKVREAVETKGPICFEVLEEVLREQTQALGLSIVDVCMDSNQVDSVQTMSAVVSELTKDFSGVMCLDSFDPAVHAEALKHYPGRPIINSISLEDTGDGRDKLAVLVGSTKHHAPVYIALCADSRGPAKTANDKCEIAKQIIDRCAALGVRAGQIIVDVNAFPIGSESESEMNYALESLRAIPLIKKLHPEVKVSIGVGNLTNGLAKKPYMRLVLTSYFLQQARENGLDAAIINPQHYVPLASIEPEHAALAHRVIYEHDLEAFAQLEAIALQRAGQAAPKVAEYDALSVDQAVCQKIKDGYKQKQSGQLREDGFVHEYHDAIVLQVAQCLKQYEPLVFVNDYLMKTMQKLGDGFATGEVSLPHLLKAADVMKHAMGYIEAKLKFENVTGNARKGVVVLGTVYQDVHSIGKDLARTLIENYGYDVVDLGVQVPLEKFVEAVKTHQAVAVGMSSLLVQTSNHMITVARLLRDEGLSDVAILIGGAPVTHRHAAQVALCGQTQVEQMLPNVFYCASAMDAVRILNEWCGSGASRQKLLTENSKRLRGHVVMQETSQPQIVVDPVYKRKALLPAWQDGELSFLSVRKRTLTPRALLPYLNRQALFSLNWRYGGRKGWVKKGVTEKQLEAQLREWIDRCEKKGWLQPQAVFGVFPCRPEGDDVVIYDQKDSSHELGRIVFSRMISVGEGKRYSCAQCFDVSSLRTFDVIGLQMVTVGRQVMTVIDDYKTAGDMDAVLALQGLADRVTEDMAEFVHGHLRFKMGVGPKAGARWSPGYPAIKDVAMNRVISDCLFATDHIDVAMTTAHMFIPPSTTAAVVCFRGGRPI